jgi:hypothetical protein
LRRTAFAALTVASAIAVAEPHAAAEPTPGSPEYVERDNRNMSDAYGRQTGDGGQLDNPEYMPALIARRSWR